MEILPNEAAGPGQGAVPGAGQNNPLCCPCMRSILFTFLSTFLRSILPFAVSFFFPLILTCLVASAGAQVPMGMCDIWS